MFELDYTECFGSETPRGCESVRNDDRRAHHRVVMSMSTRLLQLQSLPPHFINILRNVELLHVGVDTF